ncbi:MAG: ABC transporter substrate binding protein, partial [Candidatus Kryptoniota bacterium]
IKQLVPQAQTIGLMWNQTKVNASDIMPKIERAATSIGVKVVIEDVEDIRDVSQKFRDLSDNYHIQALWVFQNDDIVGSSLGRDFLIKNTTVGGIALFAPNTDWVSAGACATLMSEGGTVKLFVNKKTITALGINIPEKFIPDTQFLATN